MSGAPAAETRGLRRDLYRQLEPSAWPHRGLSPLNRVIVVLILLSAGSTVLETEAIFHPEWPDVFGPLEHGFATLFALEYLLRLWVAGEDPRWQGAGGRLRYACTPSALLDLLALAPVLLGLSGESLLLRAARLLRILRLAKLGRFSSAMRHVAIAVRMRRHELIFSVGVAGGLLLVSSCLLYLVEQEVQPEAFGSIPRAMWWSIATLTTVGYGDVYPITALGRLFAACTALTGIGLIALPTGILAAAFSDAMQRTRKAQGELE